MSTMRHTLRAATFDDVEPVAELLREVAFKARSEAGWRWLFRDNPVHRRQDPPPQMGWVLEREGTLQGYLGNVHLEYVLDGKPLRAATCTSYYVRPGSRAESTRLMSVFFRQQGIDLFLSTTANALSEPIYRLFKAVVPEDPSFSRGLVWIADDRAALRDTLAQVGVPRGLASSLAEIASPASRLVRRVTGFATVPRHESYEAVQMLGLHDLDERFDRLWDRLASASGLRVRRDAASLRWYFSDPDAGGVPVLFTVTDGEGLVGYAAAARHRPPGVKSTQMRILDMVVRPGGERAVPPLLRAVLAHARESGVGLVYSAPCGGVLAEQLGALHPYSHRHAYAAHFLRAAPRTATASLTAPGIWHATALDGDTPFCIEHVGFDEATFIEPPSQELKET
jgi:hypothetical protein